MENTVFLKIAKNSQINTIDHILVNIEPLRQFSIPYIFVHGDFSAEVVTIAVSCDNIKTTLAKYSCQSVTSNFFKLHFPLIVAFL